MPCFCTSGLQLQLLVPLISAKLELELIKAPNCAGFCVIHTGADLCVSCTYLRRFLCHAVADCVCPWRRIALVLRDTVATDDNNADSTSLVE